VLLGLPVAGGDPVVLLAASVDGLSGGLVAAVAGVEDLNGFQELLPLLDWQPTTAATAARARANSA
jgi:hypothetical protein